jgi:hypothetical protein
VLAALQRGALARCAAASPARCARTTLTGGAERFLARPDLAARAPPVAPRSSDTVTSLAIPGALTACAFFGLVRLNAHHLLPLQIPARLRAGCSHALPPLRSPQLPGLFKLSTGTGKKEGF